MLLLIGLILILFSIVLDVAGMSSEVSEKRYRESERNAEKRPAGVGWHQFHLYS